uniref:DUF2029 domain-containing protein n=1 Tax=Candidatus Kentrum sp. DK TaxID=2126562 RepID=A0A450ST33_9GAMM|nr:MAG: hypothetical protein BECKDK2373B_GA0170837_106419 [Candidatus Kentron sp. DK]
MMSSRLILSKTIIIFLAIALIFSMVIAEIYEIDFIWRFFRIDHMSPIFADLRTIPNLSDFDGLRENVSVDPWGRPFNYPEIWIYILTVIGLIQEPYILFGIFQLFLLFALFAFTVVSAPSISKLIYVSALCLSPPVFLLLERGNNDASVFVILLAMVSTRNSFVKGMLLALSGGLKIFPIFGILGAIHWKLKPALLGLFLLSPILVWSFKDLIAIKSNTPIGATLFFGVKSMAKMSCLVSEKFSILSNCYEGPLTLIYIALFSMAVLGILFLRKNSLTKFKTEYLSCELRQEIFLVFGGIFLATLLLSGSVAYRLIFVLPVLISIAFSSNALRLPEDKIRLEILLFGFLLFFSPFITKIGWDLPLVFSFILGVYFGAIMVLYARELFLHAMPGKFAIKIHAEE